MAVIEQVKLSAPKPSLKDQPSSVCSNFKFDPPFAKAISLLDQLLPVATTYMYDGFRLNSDIRMRPAMTSRPMGSSRVQSYEADAVKAIEEFIDEDIRGGQQKHRE